MDMSVVFQVLGVPYGMPLTAEQESAYHEVVRYRTRKIRAGNAEKDIYGCVSDHRLSPQGSRRRVGYMRTRTRRGNRIF